MTRELNETHWTVEATTIIEGKKIVGLTVAFIRDESLLEMNTAFVRDANSDEVLVCDEAN